jgi:hypothetical protein
MTLDDKKLLNGFMTYEDSNPAETEMQTTGGAMKAG